MKDFLRTRLWGQVSPAVNPENAIVIMPDVWGHCNIGTITLSIMSTYKFIKFGYKSETCNHNIQQISVIIMNIMKSDGKGLKNMNFWSLKMAWFLYSQMSCI